MKKQVSHLRFLFPLLMCLLSSNLGAQTALTWDQVKDRFASGNPTLKAAKANIDESRVAEITAYLRPNPDFSLSVDGTQLTPHLGVYRPFAGTQMSPAVSYLHEREQKREQHIHQPLRKHRTQARKFRYESQPVIEQLERHDEITGQEQRDDAGKQPRLIAHGQEPPPALQRVDAHEQPQRRGCRFGRVETFGHRGKSSRKCLFVQRHCERSADSLSALLSR